ncbi:MAG: hypothetical protein HOP19_15795 [Acidobacteria bacterium]|nr:hypothetical protein [Acidobacteriota bacterium]
MITTTVEYTDEDILRLGKDMYEREIKPLVPADKEGCVVAIDIQSGEFELAEDALTSAKRLHARLPGAVVYVARVGSPGLHRVGLRGRSEQS